MDKQQDRVLLLLSLLEPNRLEYPSLNFLLCTIEVEFLRGGETLAAQRVGRELRQLLDADVFENFRAEILPEVAGNEHVIW